MTGAGGASDLADVERLLALLTQRERHLLDAATPAPEAVADGRAATEQDLGLLRSHRAALLACRDVLGRRRSTAEARGHARALLRQVAADLGAPAEGGGLPSGSGRPGTASSTT